MLRSRVSLRLRKTCCGRLSALPLRVTGIRDIPRSQLPKKMTLSVCCKLTLLLLFFVKDCLRVCRCFFAYLRACQKRVTFLGNHLTPQQKSSAALSSRNDVNSGIPDLGQVVVSLVVARSGTSTAAASTCNPLSSSTANLLTTTITKPSNDSSSSPWKATDLNEKQVSERLQKFPADPRANRSSHRRSFQLAITLPQTNLHW